MSENDALTKGINLYQQGRYENALRVLQQASTERKRRKTTDITPEVLDQLVDSLRNVTSLIKQPPGSFQGYRRSGRFTSPGMKFLVSLKIVELALARMDSFDAKRRAELEILRNEIVYAKRQPQSIFERLPVEMQIEIFFLVLSSSKSNIRSLVLVCRAWKDLVYETPSLWCRLTFDFSWRTTQQTADTWLKRSNGIIRSLHIGYLPESDRNLDIFKNAAKGFWSKIEDLDLTVGDLSEYLPAKILRQLRLRSIRVTDSNFPPVQPWKSIRRLDMSNTRVLAINILYGYMDLKDLAFSKLTTLELSGGFRYKLFFDLLRRNPALETLALRNSRFWDSTSDSDRVIEPVHLPFLRRVDMMHSGHVFEEISRNVKMPNLSILRLRKCFGRSTMHCLQQVLAQNITEILEIYISGCVVSFRIVVSLLQSSPSLTTLTLSKCTYDGDGDINRVINTLCKPASSLPCPKLQCLNLSWSPDLETRSIKRLVKLRLQNPEATSENDSPSTPEQTEHPQNQVLPIFYLNIDNCRRINSRALEWLRGAVPHVSAEVSTKAREYLW